MSTPYEQRAAQCGAAGQWSGGWHGLEPLEPRVLLDAGEAGAPSSAAGGHVLPNPAIVMYGHSDNPGFTDAFGDIVPPFTVIEGTSSDD